MGACPLSLQKVVPGASPSTHYFFTVLVCLPLSQHFHPLALSSHLLLNLLSNEECWSKGSCQASQSRPWMLDLGLWSPGGTQLEGAREGQTLRAESL